jgi:hypothetical protein
MVIESMKFATKAADPAAWQESATEKGVCTKCGEGPERGSIFHGF